MSDNTKVTKDFYKLILVAAIPLICVGGVNYWTNTVRMPLIYIVFGITVLLFIISKVKLYISTCALLWTAFFGMICVSYAYSIDKSSTLNFIIIYFVSIILLYMDFSEDTIDKIIKIIQIISFIYAVSILISVVIPNCMNNYFWFIVNPSRSANVARSLAAELRIGSYSGFAREKAEAAVIMNAGIATLFAKYFSGFKLKKFDIVTLLCCIGGLILTGKRTLAIICVIMFAVFMLLSDLRGKVIKIFSVLIISLTAVLIILAFIPSMSTLFERFSDSESIANGGGRVTSLWPYAEDMFGKSPIIGMGFASYNLFAYNQGMRSFGDMWQYYAHNVYKELLGELGIVGVIILLTAIALSIIFTALYIRKAPHQSLMKKHLMFSLFIQVLFTVYSFTGNCLYQTDQIYFWFFAIAVALSTIRRIRSQCIDGSNIHHNLRRVKTI